MSPRESVRLTGIPMRLVRAAALLAPLALLGCSMAALDANPVAGAGSERAPNLAEDRINVWPIFYKNNEAFSALWPLIAGAEAGHAVIPFYEYQAEADKLRLLAIHQLLFAGATIEGDRQRWRVLNFTRDARDGKVAFVPFYFQNFEDGEVLLLPVLYKNDDILWTPLYTQTDNLKGVLGPLFFVHRDGDQLVGRVPISARRRLGGRRPPGLKGLPPLLLQSRWR